jgi:hypothetical protein
VRTPKRDGSHRPVLPRKRREDHAQVSPTEYGEPGAVERQACRDRRDAAATVPAGCKPGRKSSPLRSRMQRPRVEASHAAAAPLRGCLALAAESTARGPLLPLPSRQTREATQTAGPQRIAFRLSGRTARGTTHSYVGEACASPPHALPGGDRPQGLRPVRPAKGCIEHGSAVFGTTPHRIAQVSRVNGVRTPMLLQRRLSPDSGLISFHADG